MQPSAFSRVGLVLEEQAQRHQVDADRLHGSAITLARGRRSVFGDGRGPDGGRVTRVLHRVGVDDELVEEHPCGVGVLPPSSTCNRRSGGRAAAGCGGGTAPLEEDLPDTVAAAAFEFIAGPLRDSPHRVGKPLREPLAPLWSARRGEYRILYRILDRRLVIEVVSVAHRRDAYHR